MPIIFPAWKNQQQQAFCCQRGQVFHPQISQMETLYSFHQVYLLLCHHIFTQDNPQYLKAHHHQYCYPSIEVKAPPWLLQNTIHMCQVNCVLHWLYWCQLWCLQLEESATPNIEMSEKPSVAPSDAPTGKHHIFTRVV